MVLMKMKRAYKNITNIILFLIISLGLSLSVFAATLNVIPFELSVDDNTNFGSSDNEALGFDVGMTLNDLFVGEGLQYEYTVLDGGLYNGASPSIAVIDLGDGRHIVLFPGFAERTGTHTLTFSDTSATATADSGDVPVDFVIYPADFSSQSWSSNAQYGNWDFLKSDGSSTGGPLPLTGNELVTRVAIQHQAGNAGQEDRIESILINDINYYGFIQSAIDAASPGDTINVAAGTYDGKLVINKPLTLKGPNADISPNTGVRVAEAIITGTNVEDPIIEMTAGNLNSLTIEGFEISGVTTIGQQQVIHLIADGDDVVIRRNRFIDNSGRIFVSGPLRSGLIINDNLIDGMTQDNQAGMQLFTMSDCQITNNVVRDTTYGGIQLGSASDCTISGNEIENVPRSGIAVDNSNNVIINDNTVTNAGNGVDEGDDLTENGGITIYNPDQTDITVTNNILTANYNGIAVRNDAGQALGSGIVVNFNSISGNVNRGADNAASSGTLDARFNYWGSVFGPTTEDFEAGDAVSDNVAYSPWLTRDFETALASDTYVGFEREVGGSWDIVSTPVSLEVTDPSQLIPSLQEEGSLALMFNSDTQLWEVATSLEPLEAIYIFVSGTPARFPINPSPSVPSRDVSEGWNLWGPAPGGWELWNYIWDDDTNIYPDQAFTDLFKDVGAGLQATFTRWVSPPVGDQLWNSGSCWVTYPERDDFDYNCDDDWNAENLYLGQGYWVFMNEDDEMAGSSSTPVSLEWLED